MKLLIMQFFVIFLYSFPVGPEHHRTSLLLSPSRDQATPYISLYCLSVGFKYHLCLPLLSPSRVPAPLYVSHYSLSRVQTPVYASHYCLSVCRVQAPPMSPFTVSLSGSNTTVGLPFWYAVIVQQQL